MVHYKIEGNTEENGLLKQDTSLKASNIIDFVQRTKSNS